MGCCTPICIHWLLWGLDDLTREHTMSIATVSDRCVLILLLWPPKDCGKNLEKLLWLQLRQKVFLQKAYSQALAVT